MRKSLVGDAAIKRCGRQIICHSGVPESTRSFYLRGPGSIPGNGVIERTGP